MLLSRRRLVFTDLQMYFQCTAGYELESLSSQSTHLESSLQDRHQVFPDRGLGLSPYDLISRLQKYYEKQLSFKTDIIHAFNESEELVNRTTHFFGIPIFYSDEYADLARNYFVRNLCWFLIHTNTTTPGSLEWTGMFPSWSWASAKADRSEYGLGTLIFPHLFYEFHYSNCDIDIEVSHSTYGNMKLSEFATDGDDYELYNPYIDMTSWVLTRNHTLIAHDGFYEDGLIYDKSTLDLIYLGRDLTPWAEEAIFLVLCQVKPGVFRRVGLKHFYGEPEMLETRETTE